MLTDQQLSSLQALKSSNPEAYNGFLAKHNMPDPFVDQAPQQAPQPQNVVPQQHPNPVPQSAAPVAPAADTPTPEPPAVVDELAKLASSNPFLASIIPAAAEQTVDIFDHLSAKLGTQLTPEQRNANTLAKVIDDYADLNTRKADMEKVSASMNIINQNLGALPAPVQNIVTAALQNPDEAHIEALMRSYLDQRSIDFTKPFDKQDKLQMINKFVADSPYATLDDIPETALANLTSVAKNIYAAKQKEVASVTPSNPAEVLNARTQKFTSSVESSLAQLDALNSILAPSQKQEIASIMYSKGAGALFDAEGNYTPEAAMRLAWAKYGPTWMEQTAQHTKTLIEAAKRQGAEEAIAKGILPYDAVPRPMGVPIQNTSKEQGRQMFKSQVNSALGKG